MKSVNQDRLFLKKTAGCFFQLLLMTALVRSLICADVLAQTMTIPPDADTSRLRPLPLPLPSVPNFDLRIETPEKSAVPRAVDELTFNVKEIVVEGANQYQASQVKRLFEPLIGKATTLTAIRDAADKLEERYRKDGFFLVRVFIPPQQVKDGVFRIRVVEGFIEGIYAEGGTEPARQLIETMLAHLINKQPIDLPTLEKALLVLNDMPGVRGSGVLRQGGQLGASELVVTLSELPKKSYVVGINNTASKTMGEISSLVSMTINNPLEVHPGQLSLGFNTAGNIERLKAFNARYAMPLGTQGVVLSLGGLVANAKPGASLKALDIESNSTSLSPRLRYALSRSRGISTFVDAGLTLNYSRTTLLGNELTQDRSTVFDIGLSVLDNDRWDGSTEFGFNLSQGLVALGANRENTPSPSVAGFNSSFNKLRINFSRLQNLPNQFSVQVLGQGQVTHDTLLSGEQVFFGGMGIGRAYDTGSVAGDKGVGALVELRRDIYPGQWQVLTEGSLQLYLFTDYAEARFVNNDGAIKWLRSAGAGFRYRNSTGLGVEMLLADARRVISSTDPRHDPRLLALVTKSF